jgi:hypothetical protein
VWAFGGGLAAVLCSVLPFFLFFFIFCSRKNGFFSDVEFLYPSVFLPILTTFCQILPEISSKFTFIGQFTPSVFLLILALFC